MADQLKSIHKPAFTGGGTFSYLTEDQPVSLGEGVLPEEIRNMVNGFYKVEPKLAEIGRVELTPREESFSGTSLSFRSVQDGIETIFLVPFIGKLDNFNRKYSYSEDHGNVRYEITFEGGLESIGSVLVKNSKSVGGNEVQHNFYQFDSNGGVTESIRVEHDLTNLENTLEREFMEVSKRALFQLAKYKGNEAVAMACTDHYQPPPFFSRENASNNALTLIILAAAAYAGFRSWKILKRENKANLHN
ncbi:hypothetical protein HYU14_04900 [Candidatus Woesearchaeota archaeon]|nr:hypothetical protein [Candidatus Woesearchaeota archaeon]